MVAYALLRVTFYFVVVTYALLCLFGWFIYVWWDALALLPDVSAI